VPTDGVSQRAIRSAVKLYLAVKSDLRQDPAIRAVGMNCLNESHFLDATPCLAWNLLYEECECLWGCEADTLSMLTQYLLHRGLGLAPLMTNLYPFLLGDAALKHERIAKFPDVPAEPENHILVAHCGYMGVIPESAAAGWRLRKKVLAIVDENATAIDARLPLGDITLAKLHPTLGEITVAEGALTAYAGFPGSDCLNGGVIRVRDGPRLVESLCSHHCILVTGRHRADLELLSKVFGLEVKVF
jgi:hypothetical protein